MRNLILSLLGTILLTSCTAQTPSDQPSETKDTTLSTQASGSDCDVKLYNIHFTKSINNADSFVAVNNERVVFTAKEGTDYYNNPDKSAPLSTAPMLLTAIDNSKTFTVVTKVTPGFTQDGAFSGAALYFYFNDLLYHKLCFEQDERGLHRLVSVRTEGIADDGNHDVVEQPYVYMKISSDTKIIASYYSLDNENWQMVRLYENKYPSQMWFGISSQSPLRNECISIFEDIRIEQKSVADFRLGI